jgi:HSP20 family molecular chaperone IbpA
MATDIKENENGYQLSVDMPGFNKQDISLNLKDGYLTIEAKKEEKEDEKYLHQERYCSCSRSYYVGENITEEDVKAKYLNGTLNLNIPKKQKQIPERKQIQID